MDAGEFFPTAIDAPEFGPIVLRRDGRTSNGTTLKQHGTTEAAHREAERLARKENGVFAVYVPVYIVRPANTPVVTERLTVVFPGDEQAVAGA